MEARSCYQATQRRHCAPISVIQRRLDLNHKRSIAVGALNPNTGTGLA